MLLKLRIPFLTAIACYLLIGQTGCKEDTIIKSNVAPGSNELGVTVVPDTFTIITKSLLSTHIKTSEKSDNIRVIQGLGNIYDPYFGTTNSGIFFQVLPTRQDFQFTGGASYTIDSAVLVIPYTGFGWGDTANPQPQTFNVYEVTENMDVSKDYYSDEKLNTSGTIIGSATIDLNTALKQNPTVIDTEVAFRHIRIKMNQDFITKFNNKIKEAVLNTDAQFLDFFKGFYIRPADTNAKKDLLPYFYLDGTDNYNRLAFAFYFREDGSNETKTDFFNYVRDKTANYNYITRNYTGTRAEYWLNQYTANPDMSDDTIIVQNEPGAVLDIRIPHIKNLPLVPILKAELVIKSAVTGINDSLSAPSRLIVEGIDESGEIYTIQDLISSSPLAAAAFINGLKDFEVDQFGNTTVVYRINIPREVQKSVREGKKELHLRVRSVPTFPAAYRLIAGGSKNLTYKTEFNIVFSSPE